MPGDCKGASVPIFKKGKKSSENSKADYKAVNPYTT